MIIVARSSMTRTGSRMYTSTHKILYHYFLSKFSCSGTGETSLNIARSLCHHIVDEADDLHKMIVNLDYKVDHCVLDLWLEQG